MVHRTWDVNSQIKISMFDDRIEIVSPGGLSKEEYLLGQISILRNPILANLFYRLGLIEQFGMGIRRIISSYQGSVIQPKFKIFENSIVIILPLFQSVSVNLSEDEGKIYQAVQSGNETTSKINEVVGFGKTKSLRLINSLVKKGYLIKVGEGRGTKYMLPK
ncbi:hydrolase [Lactobacillus delbrueckii subsp. bulgaricus]|uniref:Transcriptional regulator n=3 Tax=Lactobacillus delbrueckii TaxID=1584 RepID=A0AAV5PJ14_LACDE|nr:hydrolase [Lactobacillus delbrueckii subsp. bulgaricus]MPW12365.1 hydrolase [Lactobacillus delbrueckii]MBT8854615.1 hydrolase [Lactobacillus delbrueckii subsp. bulgaricus]MBT8857720.1 hydrolase [Lactobacillus delbrueckii subsp. bulgaricus]MBT8867261.1 hydrolase [Lactobacillus delbrueckii subsp. bulgaricus]